jgi:hypothetical protein
MGWIRKVYRGRGSYFISLPKGVIEGMGASRGTPVRIEQPFTDTVILGGMERFGMAMYPEMVRCLGWLAGQNGRMPGLAAMYGKRYAGTEPCGVCRLWQAEHDLGFALVCRMCCQEIGIAIAFRQRPCQPELELKAAAGAGGGATPAFGVTPGSGAVGRPASEDGPRAPEDA